MFRFSVFMWTLVATLFGMLTVFLVATIAFLTLIQSSSLVPAEYMIMYAVVLWLFLGIGLGTCFGIAGAVLPRKEAEMWLDTAKKVALWGNPFGAILWSGTHIFKLVT